MSEKGKTAAGNGVALIDGDIIVYRIGFASDTVSEKIALARVDDFITDLVLFQLGANYSDYHGYITSNDPKFPNYRIEYAKTVPYKGNRTAAKPKHYQAIRDYLQSKFGFQCVVFQEADDTIGIQATKLWNEGNKPFIIATIDKDLDNIPGWHYNFVKKEKYFVTSHEARRNFWTQVIVGDVADNIKGVKGIGPVKAKKILETCNSDYQYYSMSISAFQSKENLTYTESKERVIENCRLLWIRTKPNEIWEPPT